MASEIRTEWDAALRGKYRFRLLSQFQSAQKPTHSDRLEHAFLDYFTVYGGECHCKKLFPGTAWQVALLL